mmetsp:Transcript_41134/g.94622  ORF Transcript_41134/g.94622 Transcript_41134/m.94622 type:complete len:397 (-) Transcript_41134:143-1333(-)
MAAAAELTMAYSGRPGFHPDVTKDTTMAALSQSRPIPTSEVPKDLDHLAHDQRLTAIITRRRQEELHRRSKLFDPRTRQFGCDPQLLEGQLLAKRELAEKQFAEEAFHAKNALMADQVAEVFELEKAKQKRERHKACMEYSAEHLSKEKRREYHLSDPLQLKNQSPHEVQPPLAKDDVTHQREKKKYEQEFLRGWLSQQMKEKKDREDAEKAEDALWARDALAANEIRTVVEQDELREQREAKLKEAEDNKALADVHRNRKIRQRMKEAQDTMKHADALTGNALDSSDIQRGLDGRVLPTGFKRFGPEEEQDMYNTNLGLVYHRQLRAHEDHMVESEWAKHSHTAAKVLDAIEVEKSKQASSRQRQLVEENKRLAEEKQLRDLEDRRKIKIFEHVP